MKRITLVAIGALLTLGSFGLVAQSAFADPPAGVGGGPPAVSPGPPADVTPGPPTTTVPGADCSHGVNDDGTCRPDPNPAGQDCDEHGVPNPAGNDGNEDHCLPDETVTTTTPPPVVTTPPPVVTTPPPVVTTPPPTPTEAPNPPAPGEVVDEPTIGGATTVKNPEEATVNVSNFYGDPLLDIRIDGGDTGGRYRITGGDGDGEWKAEITGDVEAGEVIRFRGYHVDPGATARVFLDGVLVFEETA